MQRRIFIAEDHTIVREGLRKIIETVPQFQVVGEAGDGIEAVSRVMELKPELLLLDLSMPKMNGVEVIRQLRKTRPETRILVLSMHNALEHVLPVLQEGVNGYVLKDARQNELLEAIKIILSGKKYLSPAVQEKLDFHEIYGNMKKHKSVSSPLDQLTNREREILKLVAEGHSNKQIGELLDISPKTVDKHRCNLMAKTQIHSARELTLFALKHGIIETG